MLAKYNQIDVKVQNYKIDSYVRNIELIKIYNFERFFRKI
jgi:hypothetical protein